MLQRQARQRLAKKREQLLMANIKQRLQRAQQLQRAHSVEAVTVLKAELKLIREAELRRQQLKAKKAAEAAKQAALAQARAQQAAAGRAAQSPRDPRQPAAAPATTATSPTATATSPAPADFSGLSPQEAASLRAWQAHTADWVADPAAVASYRAEHREATRIEAVVSVFEEDKTKKREIRDLRQAINLAVNQIQPTAHVVQEKARLLFQVLNTSKRSPTHYLYAKWWLCKRIVRQVHQTAQNPKLVYPFATVAVLVAAQRHNIWSLLKHALVTSTGGMFIVPYYLRVKPGETADAYLARYGVPAGDDGMLRFSKSLVSIVSFYSSVCTTGPPSGASRSRGRAVALARRGSQPRSLLWHGADTVCHAAERRARSVFCLRCAVSEAAAVSQVALSGALSQARADHRRRGGALQHSPAGAVAQEGGGGQLLEL